jgi:hypothetical protein
MWHWSGMVGEDPSLKMGVDDPVTLLSSMNEGRLTRRLLLFPFIRSIGKSGSISGWAGGSFKWLLCLCRYCLLSTIWKSIYTFNVLFQQWKLAASFKNLLFHSFGNMRVCPFFRVQIVVLQQEEWIRWLRNRQLEHHSGSQWTCWSSRYSWSSW